MELLAVYFHFAHYSTIRVISIFQEWLINLRITWSLRLPLKLANSFLIIMGKIYVKFNWNNGFNLNKFHRCHYTDSTLEERQMKLNSIYKFSCRCTACQNPQIFTSVRNLDIKDYKALLKENMYVVVGDDFKAANQRLERFCRYIQKNYWRNNPCNEIYAFQDTFIKILKVFAMNENY